MTDTMNETAPEVAMRRIKGLLAKAEGTTNSHEAEAFFAKAAELMEKYRIDAEMVRAARGDAEEAIEGVVYPLAQRAKFLRASLQLVLAVSQHYSVKVLIGATGNSKTPRLVGTPSDIEATTMMFESLVRQRDIECMNTAVPYGVAANTFRNSFCYGYAATIHKRLKEIREAAKAAAAGDVGMSQALVMIDRRLQRVDDYLGNSVRKAQHNGPRLNGQGVNTGKAAGERADLGQRRFDSGPRALGR